MDEVTVGKDRIIEKESIRDGQLVVGAVDVRETGVADFLVPTIEKSQTLRAMANDLVERGRGMGVSEFLKEAARVVYDYLPYGDIHTDRGVDEMTMTADMMRNLDNLKYAIDSGFSTGAVCRHQAPVLLGLLRAFEFEKEFQDRGPIKNVGEKSSFSLLYFALKPTGGHMVVYDWKERLIVDPTNRRVIEVGDLEKAYDKDVDKESIWVLQLSSGDSRIIQFKKFLKSPFKYLN